MPPNTEQHFIGLSSLRGSRLLHRLLLGWLLFALLLFSWRLFALVLFGLLLSRLLFCLWLLVRLPELNASGLERLLQDWL